jgi:putative ABC transport system ATP-binding protein
MLRLESVRKVYSKGGKGSGDAARQVEAVRGVSLEIVPGEFVSIMGPSGSGKSTLMHLLGALDTPTEGRAIFEERDLATLTDSERSRLRRDRIGFIFQFFNLLPNLSAGENVALPLLLAGIGRRMALARADECLERVGLSQRARHLPDELSGGEMQRVAVARALAPKPRAILCDEPTGNLDTGNARAILDLLRQLPEPGGASVVMVTHDQAAGARADRIVHVRDGLIDREERQSPTRSPA